MKALALTAGPSTLEAALYDVEPGVALGAPPEARWRDEIDWDPADGGAVADQLLRRLCEGADPPLRSPGELDVVGHRIVHGGTRFHGPARMSDELKEELGALAPFAPLHNAAGLAGVAAAERFAGVGTPQVAVFDTAFHADLAPSAHAYTGPPEWQKRGLRRFGFHGINHEYAAHRAALLLGRPLADLRMVICHLGSGGSLAAVRDGRSVDTTMTFTPLEGLVTGMRSGAPDPGLLLHALREPGASIASIRSQLDDRSDPRGPAFDIYVHRLRFHIGAMLGALGGLDAIVFTGGAGEHCAALRGAALAPFAFLELKLDPRRNEEAAADTDIAAARSAVRVPVVRAREHWAIARAAAGAVSDG